ncbi:MAG: hypothetical protein U1E67_12850 [Hyphomicrobiales bacterium]
MRISPVDDPLEREADRVADQVVSGGLAGVISGNSSGAAQRKCAQCRSRGNSGIAQSRIGGRDIQTEPHMRFRRSRRAARRSLRAGALISGRVSDATFQVRVHTNGSAAKHRGQSMRTPARSDATSLSLRSSIAQDRKRKRLIAHELAHARPSSGQFTAGSNAPAPADESPEASQPFSQLS